MRQIGSLFAVLVVMVLLLVGCSGGGKPSDAEIEKAISADFMKGGKVIEVKDFVKTSEVQNDANTYTADVEFDIFYDAPTTAELKRLTGKTSKHIKINVTFIKSDKGWVIKESKNIP